ncbi:MAG: hypothetical protein HQK78_16755 [Desulfobacterales bacterium]|nr:hypothetical protein [Desulfobacterales bacterium]
MLSLTNKEYREVLNELKELEELKKSKMLLESENNRLKNEIDILTTELEGIAFTISSSESYLSSFEDNKNKYLKSIEDLTSKKEVIMNGLTEFRSKMKIVKEDMESSAKLQEDLIHELRDISNEKGIVIKRLDSIKLGLEKIYDEKNTRIPNLNLCESLLKHIYTSLKDTQNRMEVSVLLNK